MPRRPSQQQLFDELVDRYGLEIAQAFMAAIEDLRKGADLQRVIAAVEAGNIEAALDALHLDASAYARMLAAIRGSYQAGGEGALNYLPAKGPNGAALVVRFDARNIAAENWLREHSSTLVTRIVDDQRQAVRTALTRGMMEGINPRTSSLDVVGRVNRATGKREGGVLGLSSPQEQYARTAAAELASTDPTNLKAYLGRTRRDKRFDRTIQKAIDNGTSVPAEVQAKAVQSYRNRLIALRGELIGRTEAIASLQAAKLQAYRQAVAEGKLDPADVRRTWRSAGDTRVRHTHAVMHGETVGLEEPFRSPSGARLMFPGDTSLGAPGSEVIGCRCNVNFRVDFLSNLR